MTIDAIHVSIQSLEINTSNNWDLICKCCSCGYHIHNLTGKQKNDLYIKIYAQSDGYGEPGYIPVQGFDWSGIRDSSSQAKEAMSSVARDYLRAIGKSALFYSRNF